MNAVTPAEAQVSGGAAHSRRIAPPVLMATAAFVVLRAMVTITAVGIAYSAGSSWTPLVPAAVAAVCAVVAAPVLVAAALQRCPRWISVPAGLVVAGLLVLEVVLAIALVSRAYDAVWPIALWLAFGFVTSPFVVAAMWWPVAAKGKVISAAPATKRED